MKVRIKFFSVFRDAVEAPEIETELEKPLTINQLICLLNERFPKLGKILRIVKPIVIVDGKVVDEGFVIDRDVEIAIAPPASGGIDVKVSVFTDDVSVDKVVEELVSGSVGAIVLFIGVVKGVVDGYKVYELIYDVYEPYATKVLEKIAREEAEKHHLNAVQIHHRVGVAKPGQKTVVIAVSAKSRAEALEALRSILERVKSEPPIYKLERREDGEFWVIGDGKRIPRARS
jgi:molybdopterin synthase catalytic subunit